MPEKKPHSMLVSKGGISDISLPIQMKTVWGNTAMFKTNNPPQSLDVTQNELYKLMTWKILRVNLFLHSRLQFSMAHSHFKTFKNAKG